MIDSNGVRRYLDSLEHFVGQRLADAKLKLDGGHPEGAEEDRKQLIGNIRDLGYHPVGGSCIWYLEGTTWGHVEDVDAFKGYYERLTPNSPTNADMRFITKTLFE